jgi:hypothetical protein
MAEMMEIVIVCVFLRINKQAASLPRGNDALMHYFFNGQVLMPSNE